MNNIRNIIVEENNSVSVDLESKDRDNEIFIS